MELEKEWQLYTISSLPCEILENILDKVPTKNMAALTCKTWHAILRRIRPRIDGYYFDNWEEYKYKDDLILCGVPNDGEWVKKSINEMSVRLLFRDASRVCISKILQKHPNFLNGSTMILYRIVIMFDRDDVLDWLSMNYDIIEFIRSLNCSNACDLAAKYGSLKCLQWLRTRNHPFSWSVSTSANALRSEHAHVLDWLLSQNPPCPISPHYVQLEIPNISSENLVEIVRILTKHNIL